MVQIECLIIGVNFITTRKVAALHRLTVHHLCNRVLANYSITYASTVAVVGVRTPPKFWTWVSDTPNLLAAPYNNTITVFERNIMGLLKQFTIIEALNML